MNDDEDIKQKNRDFTAARAEAAQLLIDCALALEDKNPAKAALSLRAAAETMHCEAILRLAEKSTTHDVEIYDRYHSALEASSKEATRRILAANGIDYSPAVAVVVNAEQSNEPVDLSKVN